jgi:transcriptional regulator with XRE-family HTH domain
MYIGKRLKELREMRKMSLTDLAEKSGVQIATLSRIEHLKMTGTLESHMNIAKALGIDITQLYAGIIKEEDKIDHRTARAATDVFAYSDKSSYEILTANILSKKMMPILLKIEPDGETKKEQNQGGTEKFIFVVEGKIEAIVGKNSYSLSKHNTLYFDASLEHRIVNQGKTTAKVLCVTTPVAL